LRRDCVANPHDDAVGQTKPGRGKNRALAHPEWRGFDKFSLSITPPAAATRSSCLLSAPDRVSCCVAAIGSGFTQGTFYAFADFLAQYLQESTARCSPDSPAYHAFSREE